MLVCQRVILHAFATSFIFHDSEVPYFFALLENGEDFPFSELYRPFFAWNGQLQ
jgi:hypothetical protein